MPPEENTNKNNPNLNPLKIGIDPVFKGNVNQQTSAPQQSPAANAFNVLNNQTYTPAEPPVSSLQKAIDNTTSNTNPKSIVRTYKSDLESAIEANHLSSINIAIAESQKKLSQAQISPQQPPQQSPYSKSKILIFISYILLIVGIVAIFITFFIKKQNTNPIIKVQELPSLITTEYKDELNIDTIAKNKFNTTLASKLNDLQIPVNNFYNTYLTTSSSSARRLITTVEFINQTQFKMPDILKRSLRSDFMIGMYSANKNQPFIIFKTSYFENTYAGLLNWETDMRKDFQIIFKLPAYETNTGFQDAVIVNKDVRLVKNENGEVILLYAIVDKETIIITTSDTSFKEILSRINKEKGLRR